eukprot:GHRR01009594.1.p1 GENE.GHRR01009594.1~~GHRR01009594.1.p1  ORF type:complete len:187 (+),score=25.17 GHRR01009594.1:1049-1609(+)
MFTRPLCWPTQVIVIWVSLWSEVIRQVCCYTMPVLTNFMLVDIWLLACLLTNLRPAFAHCHVLEKLTGTIPDYITTMPILTEVKLEDNQLIGTISPEFGRMKLRRFQVEINHMVGPIPETFRNITPYLTQLHLADNDFEGNLSAVAAGHLTTVTVYNNPKLCGMVPATVRYAKNYNPAGTRLGQPC